MVRRFIEIAEGVVEGTENAKKPLPSVDYNPVEGMIKLSSNDKDYLISPFDLRNNCGCAACIDEFSGV